MSQASLGGCTGLGVAVDTVEAISFSRLDAALEGVLLVMLGRGQFHSGLRLKSNLIVSERKAVLL
jgi:hypothetical protein